MHSNSYSSQTQSTRTGSLHSQNSLYSQKSNGRKGDKKRNNGEAVSSTLSAMLAGATTGALTIAALKALWPDYRVYIDARIEEIRRQNPLLTSTEVTNIIHKELEPLKEDVKTIKTTTQNTNETTKDTNTKVTNIEKKLDNVEKNVKDTNTKVTDMKDKVDNIDKTTKDTNERVKKMETEIHTSGGVVADDTPANKIQASQLYRNINTDNDYGQDSNLSNQEMIDYYGRNNGSNLTDYAIMQKYKEFGLIDLNNEKEKLTNWDAIMKTAQHQADLASDYIDKYGSEEHWYNYIPLLGGNKFLTDDDLLSQNLSGKNIAIIKKYDAPENGGNNDGKIDKQELTNAAVLGGVSLKQNTLDSESQELFDTLSGGDNVITEQELNILDQLGLNTREMFEKYKFQTGGKVGIIPGDAGDAFNEIDYDKINKYINTLPKDMRTRILDTADKNRDGMISSRGELAKAINCMYELGNDPHRNEFYHTDFVIRDRNGDTDATMRVYNKDLKEGYLFKYDEKTNTFVKSYDFDLSKQNFKDEEIKDILINKRQFLDIGTFKSGDQIINGVTLLDDQMKNAIAKTYGKKTCDPEDVEAFQKKWQCHTLDDVFNLTALKNNVIHSKRLFGQETSISTQTLYDKTIAGFDKTGETAKILDYADGNLDGHVQKDLFTNPYVEIDGKTFTLDKNGDGIVTTEELDMFTKEVKTYLGEEKMQQISKAIELKDEPVATHEQDTQPETPTQPGYDSTPKAVNNDPTNVSPHGQEAPDASTPAL